MCQKEWKTFPFESKTHFPPGEYLVIIFGELGLLIPLALPFINCPSV